MENITEEIIILKEKTKNQDKEIDKLGSEFKSMKKEFKEEIKIIKSQNNKALWFTISTLIGVIMIIAFK